MSDEIKALLMSSGPVFNSVYRDDEYGIRSLGIRPKFVLDIGAHIGCFSALAKEVWPDCVVIAVEPNEDNVRKLLKIAGKVTEMYVIHAAMGSGSVYRVNCEVDWGCCYLSDGCADAVNATPSSLLSLKPSKVKTVTLADLACLYGLRKDDVYVVKVDCEGAEACLCNDEKSTEVLRQSEYFVIEVHVRQMEWNEQPTAETFSKQILQANRTFIRSMLEWIYGLTDSHSIRLHFNAGLYWGVHGRKHKVLSKMQMPFTQDIVV